MASHYFLPIGITSPLIHPHGLQHEWNATVEGVAFFVNAAPQSGDPDCMIGTKLGVGFEPDIISQNVNYGQLPTLTVAGAAVIGYNPNPKPAGVAENCSSTMLAQQGLTNGVLVKGRIRSATAVVGHDTPIAKFDDTTIELGDHASTSATTSLSMRLTNLNVNCSAFSQWSFQDALNVSVAKASQWTFTSGLAVQTSSGDLKLTANSVGHGIHIDGPIYVQSTGSPTRLEVTNGPIVQIDTSMTNVQPDMVDARHIVIGAYGKAKDPEYGIKIQGDDNDKAGICLTKVQKYKKKKSGKKIGKGKWTWEKDGSPHQDTIVFWGDDPDDTLRIRFKGTLPTYKYKDKNGKIITIPYLDYKKGARGRFNDRYGDELRRRASKETLKTKKAGFNEVADYRDIVLIESDGSFKVNGKIYCYATAKWSDARLKEFVRPIRGALDKVVGMRGVSYRWRLDEMQDAYVKDRRQLGLLAQEIETVCPEAVSTEKMDGVNTKTVDYTQLVPVLIEAIKEQQTLIESQRQRLESLERAVRGDEPAAPCQIPSKSPRPRNRSSKLHDA